MVGSISPTVARVHVNIKYQAPSIPYQGMAKLSGLTIPTAYIV
jgi:hypothetical protein